MIVWKTPKYKADFIRGDLTDSLGSVALNIGADETSMDIESKQLMEICFPTVKRFP
ncbi:hypothetical protein FB550_10887 [Neobacillus bataviensis]|uniref:Uncharacterized protein n=1 Tax=Neobacillus bataviensis TaxID=220685 RepID=A0A561D5W2_9BACI|nr:hypothetical protein FB550_10887 [Neobacillus bataviensis]